MRRTTEQWEELLDGITPGEWEAREDHGGMNLFAGSERVFGSDSCGDVSGAEEDVRLAAVAPEAVAEVIRLRKAIESLRAFVDGFPLVPPLVGMGSIEDRAREMQSAASDALTRILEGDNHE